MPSIKLHVYEVAPVEVFVKRTDDKSSTLSNGGKVKLAVGNGVTVTVIVKVVPKHKPDADVGVTRYCTVPDVLLEFVSC